LVAVFGGFIKTVGDFANGTYRYPPAGTAPTPYAGDALACVVADFSTALLEVHGNGARLKGLLTTHLRRLLVQHAADLPGKHLKALFLTRDITVSYWEEAYAMWQWWCKHVHADRDPGVLSSLLTARIAMYTVEVRREMRAAGLEAELNEAKMMGSESMHMHRTMRHWMGVRRWRAHITRFFQAVGGAAAKLPPGRRGEYEGACVHRSDAHSQTAARQQRRKDTVVTCRLPTVTAATAAGEVVLPAGGPVTTVPAGNSARRVAATVIVRRNTLARNGAAVAAPQTTSSNAECDG
jgi:hypothetical protein